MDNVEKLMGGLNALRTVVQSQIPKIAAGLQANCSAVDTNTITLAAVISAHTEKIEGSLSKLLAQTENIADNTKKFPVAEGISVVSDFTGGVAAGWDIFDKVKDVYGNASVGKSPRASQEGQLVVGSPIAQIGTDSGNAGNTVGGAGLDGSTMEKTIAWLKESAAAWAQQTAEKVADKWVDLQIMALYTAHYIKAFGELIAIVVLPVKDWDTVKAVAIGVWEAIKSAFGNAWKWFRDTVLDPLVNGFKGMVNGVIGFLNSMIAGIVAGINGIIGLLNKLKFKAPDWIPGLGGETFGFQIKTLTTPKIPYLAQGAVLPANRPFLAMLGDQKHGTNVEAPLDTIKQAVAEVMAMQGGGDVVIRFAGDLAQLGRVLKPVIDKENRRAGTSLAKGVL